MRNPMNGGLPHCTLQIVENDQHPFPADQSLDSECPLRYRLPRTDDADDIPTRQAKRRRIEQNAKGWLAGRALYIHSAQIKGHWKKNPWTKVRNVKEIERKHSKIAKVDDTKISETKMKPPVSARNLARSITTGSSSITAGENESPEGYTQNIDSHAAKSVRRQTAPIPSSREASIMELPEAQPRIDSAFRSPPLDSSTQQQQPKLRLPHTTVPVREGETASEDVYAPMPLRQFKPVLRDSTDYFFNSKAKPADYNDATMSGGRTSPSTVLKRSLPVVNPGRNRLPMPATPTPQLARRARGTTRARNDLSSLANSRRREVMDLAGVTRAKSTEVQELPKSREKRIDANRERLVRHADGSVRKGDGTVVVQPIAGLERRRDMVAAPRSAESQMLVNNLEAGNKKDLNPLARVGRTMLGGMELPSFEFRKGRTKQIKESEIQHVSSLDLENGDALPRETQTILDTVEEGEDQMMDTPRPLPKSGEEMEGEKLPETGKPMFATQDVDENDLLDFQAAVDQGQEAIQQAIIEENWRNLQLGDEELDETADSRLQPELSAVKQSTRKRRVSDSGSQKESRKSRTVAAPTARSSTPVQDATPPVIQMPPPPTPTPIVRFKNRLAAVSPVSPVRDSDISLLESQQAKSQPGPRIQSRTMKTQTSLGTQPPVTQVASPKESQSTKKSSPVKQVNNRLSMLLQFSSPPPSSPPEVDLDNVPDHHSEPEAHAVLQLSQRYQFELQSSGLSSPPGTQELDEEESKIESSKAQMRMLNDEPTTTQEPSPDGSHHTKISLDPQSVIREFQRGSQEKTSPYIPSDTPHATASSNLAATSSEPVPTASFVNVLAASTATPLIRVNPHSPFKSADQPAVTTKTLERPTFTPINSPAGIRRLSQPQTLDDTTLSVSRPEFMSPKRGLNSGYTPFSTLKMSPRKSAIKRPNLHTPFSFSQFVSQPVGLEGSGDVTISPLKQRGDVDEEQATQFDLDSVLSGVDDFLMGGTFDVVSEARSFGANGGGGSGVSMLRREL